MGAIFSVAGTALTTSGVLQFIQLRSGADRICKIHEIRVWQTSDTTLAMNGIVITRGANGAGGTALTEYEMDVVGQANVAEGFSNATALTAVSSGDLIINSGWNILQEFVWLPTPDFRLHLAASDDIGISLQISDTLTVSCNIIWEEIGA